MSTDNAPTIEQLSEQVASLQAQIDDIKASSLPEDKLSMVVFSGDLDKQLAAFIIATGASAMFDEVVMFFTFWGTAALRDPNKNKQGKDPISKMFGWMLPKGSQKLKLSQMHMGGMGTNMMKGLMKKKNVMSHEQLIQAAADAGVRIVVCQMSMDLMGMSMDEMIDYPNMKVGGVAAFLGDAGTSKTTLFI